MKTGFYKEEEKKRPLIIKQLEEYKKNCGKDGAATKELVNKVIKVLHKIDLIPEIVEPKIEIGLDLVDLIYEVNSNYKLIIRIGDHFSVNYISNKGEAQQVKRRYKKDIIEWINEVTKELKEDRIGIFNWLNNED